MAALRRDCRGDISNFGLSPTSEDDARPLKSKPHCRGLPNACAAPGQKRDLACVGYRQATSGALYRWESERGEEVLEVAVDGPLTLDDPDLMVAAALDGVGLAYAIEEQVAAQLAAGRLVRALEEWCKPSPDFFL